MLLLGCFEGNFIKANLFFTSALYDYPEAVLERMRRHSVPTVYKIYVCTNDEVGTPQLRLS